MQKIILASQSPRRRVLLAQMGVEFDVVPSEYDEQFDESRDPYELVQELALGKARDVARHHEDQLVLGSDTFVVFRGQQVGKPTSPEHAFEMLRMLSGNTHEVVSGVALVHAGKQYEVTDLATTKVTFGQHTDEALRAYVATGDPLDKAGSYGIMYMNKGGFLVESIEGDEDTVAGLPTRLVASMLGEYETRDKQL